MHEKYARHGVRNCGKEGKMNIQWDGERYIKAFSFVPAYGSSVMELIDFAGADSAIDLGCGNGALTKKLQEKGLSVIGIDASCELLAIARKHYPEIPFIQADATAFSVEKPVDVVFSNAVFHWIEAEKQPKMLSCVFRALRPGGQFVFEFGGHGNNALIHAALEETFRAHGYSYRMPFYFPSIGAYARLVEQAGFLVKSAILFDRPTQLNGADGLRDWIKMFIQTPFQSIPDPAEQEKIIRHAVESLKSTLCRDGVWYADYVRLRMKAVKQ